MASIAKDWTVVIGLAIVGFGLKSYFSKPSFEQPTQAQASEQNLSKPSPQPAEIAKPKVVKVVDDVPLVHLSPTMDWQVHSTTDPMTGKSKYMAALSSSTNRPSSVIEFECSGGEALIMLSITNIDPDIGSQESISPMVRIGHTPASEGFGYKLGKTGALTIYQLDGSYQKQVRDNEPIYIRISEGHQVLTMGFEAASGTAAALAPILACHK